MATSTEEDVCALIRLAFACEATKRPMRRDDIISLVLGGGRKSLRALVGQANERLARDFGLQLVPLSGQTRPVSTTTVAGRKAAIALATNPDVGGAGGRTSNVLSTPSATNAYILVVTRERSPDLAYHRQPEQLGVLTTILCLIALGGGALEEETLRQTLHSLGRVLPEEQLNNWLAEWRRQRYLSLGRRPDEPTVPVFMAGTRAALEFPPEHLAGFIVDLWTGNATDGRNDGLSSSMAEERTILTARLKATLQVTHTTARGSSVSEEGRGQAGTDEDSHGVGVET